MTLSLLCAGAVFAAGGATSVRRQLVLADESRAKLHYYDSSSPSNCFSVAVVKPVWDLKQVGPRTFRTVCSGGFQVVDMGTRRVVEDFRHPSLSEPDFVVTAICDLPDGGFVASVNPQQTTDDFQRTVLLRRFDAARSPVATYRLDGRFYARSMHWDRDGRTLLLAWEKGFSRVRLPDDLGGEAVELNDFRQPQGRNLFDVVPERRGGGYLAGCGYRGGFVRFDAEGRATRTWLVPTSPTKESLFYAQIDERPNGHVYLAHWTGHGADDSRKGVQVVEFDKSGNVVWQLDDAARFGSISGVISLLPDEEAPESP